MTNKFQEFREKISCINSTNFFSHFWGFSATSESDINLSRNHDKKITTNASEKGGIFQKNYIII